MIKKNLSKVTKEMAEVILRKENVSPQTIDVALKIVHIAWNLAHDEYKDEPAYIHGIKEIQPLITSMKEEFISESVEEMSEKLIRYKSRYYPNDNRTIYSCGFKNGSVKVTWT